MTYYLFSAIPMNTTACPRPCIAFQLMTNGEILVHHSALANGSRIIYPGRNGEALSVKSGYSHHVQIVRDMWRLLREQGWTTE